MDALPATDCTSGAVHARTCAAYLAPFGSSIWHRGQAIVVVEASLATTTGPVPSDSVLGPVALAWHEEGEARKGLEDVEQK